MNHAAINALVAERVMGWKVRRESGHHWEVPLESPYFREWDQATWPHTPDFAGNIAHAMEVFDKWTHASIEKSGGAYEVTINSWATEYRTDICIAICLAALRAMGVPDKEIEEVCGGE